MRISRITSIIRTRRWAVLVAGAVVTGSLVAAAPGASASVAIAPPVAAVHFSAATPSKSPAVKPTIVLVHGAWADQSSFAPVAKRLQGDGYTVVNEPNPLQGLASDAAYLDAFITQRTTGSVILVGHSYGGAVITNITNEPRVKALVYVDAFAPLEGQSVLALTASVPGGGDIFDQFAYPGAPAGDVDLFIKPSVFPTVFANGLPAAEAKELAASQTPVTFSALNAESGPPSFAHLPSWYVLGTQDRVIAPSLQLQMATAAHSHIVRVASGHLSMLTHPCLVTEVIERAAHAAG